MPLWRSAFFLNTRRDFDFENRMPFERGANAENKLNVEHGTWNSECRIAGVQLLKLLVSSNQSCAGVREILEPPFHHFVN